MDRGSGNVIGIQMNERIVLIGAGSAVFTRGLVADLIRLNVQADLALVDIDPHALRVAELLTRKMIQSKNAPITVRASTNRRDVLKDATAVVCTIGVGGRRAWEQDVFIPRKYGIFAPVGDTVGPGGSSRALRMIPAMIDIARDVLDLAPNALFFNYSNPMAVICRAVHKATGANMVGLCHGVQHVAEIIAEFLDEPSEDLGYTAVGINHLTWFTKVSLRGEDAMPRLRALAEQRLAIGVPNDPMPAYPFAAMDWPHHNFFSLELVLRFGAIASALDRHVTEFFPQFFRTGHYYGQRLGVDAFSFETTIAEGDEIFAAMEKDALDSQPLPADYFEREQGDHELVMDIINAIRDNRELVISANLPNTGQVPNLPSTAIIESPAVTRNGTLHALPQEPLSSAIAGALATRYQWVETIVEAALEGSRDKFIQALVLDGYVESFDIAAKLADELLAEQAAYLPQFKLT
jgi:alpha-galactosidase